MRCCFVWRHTNSLDILSIATIPVAQTTHADGLVAMPHIQVIQQEMRSNSPLQSFLDADATQLLGGSDIIEEGNDYLHDGFFESHFDSTPSQPSAARRAWNVALKRYQSSRMHSSPSTHFRRSLGSAHALLTRIPLSFRYPHPDTNDTTKSQQIQPRVPSKLLQYGTNRFSLFVARWPERDKVKGQPPQKESSQTQTASQSSQNHPAVTLTSATAPAPGTSTTMSSAGTTQSQPILFRAHIVLFLCCVVPVPIN
ncbi:uncharacterized protein F5147DRAFT_774326 [Suillus discolor]|uniref:Uncharacterized protein n=1 Tax=Suillus discolor TaxID=1912936 RepID=A0A9P7F6H0_9AGAM|nr:uncharacterized protein F5147DRAFT_774326 [Suillus discolor]KAG2107494.1 hypothetical protein F5147DRAFT_774326 [Suillus discolor]